ncbi:hypothetical protein ABIB57_004790 [Devosia sp. UYZn731]|uniref:hypothetical protein n=1 Tax=Devosia sp. UYZn731 TaxID=3156345 RepID=UPI003392EAC2
MALGILLLGPSELMSWWGVLLVLALDMVLVLGLGVTGDKTAAHVIVLAWFMILFFLPRLAAFLLFPAQMITFVGIDAFSSSEISNGLLFIVAGTAALLIGFVIGALVPGPKADTVPRSFPLSGIFLYWIPCGAAAYFVYFVLQISIFGEPSAWGSPMGWLVRVFDTDAALMMLICWAVLQRSVTPWKVLVVGLGVFLWIVLSIILGSRGGGLRIFLIFGMAAIARYGNVRLSGRRFAGVLVAAVAVSALIYPLGTVIRIAQGESKNAVAQVAADWLRVRTVDVDLEAMWPLRRMAVSSPLVQNVALVVSPVITRLGLIDYPLQIINRPADQAVIDRFMTPLYSLKNYLNNMVPGELFPGYDIMTSRVFTMAYRGYDENHVRTAFLSEPWTAWGYAWLQGGAVGGLLLMTVMAAAVQAGYLTVQRLVGPMFAPYAATGWLFLATTSGLLQLFGLDHWLTICSHFAIALSIGWLCMVLAKVFWERMGPAPSAGV